ncbi:DUF3558 domain-containing protein [Saccharopolyspora sp. K220]|uniref:DUF3558 domain-containing protein n=1 Tax=Saccharopolyspora soli TaxID=2926618 RepID=UPI001F59BD98|nr:DUF3558 domain-containing protein [Saccharopolyspora soli]MCI2423925.1 DUF3558 domain-containing protein [Saccharopolyspora soli]
MTRTLPKASVEEMLRRKVLAVGAALFSLLVAGCGGGTETPPSTGETTEQAATTQQAATPPRTGPAKATEVADKCSLVSESQSQSLGADQTPRERDSNGRPGCQYQKGEAGAGWSVFVAASGETTFAQEVGKRRAPNKTSDLGGYPTVAYEETTGCVVYVDISDSGFLISNLAITGSDTIDSCGQAEKFAEAALHNLPNA